MKRSSSIVKGLMVALPALGLLLAPHEAWAGSKLFDAFSTCTTIDCATTKISGAYETNASGRTDPFVVQIFSEGNECVRLAGVWLSQNTDLEATLIAPDGTMWQDDDSNGNFRPLIKAQTRVKGWYTLQISHHSGGEANAEFIFNYGRYPSTNINCSSPTTPRSLGTTPSKPR